MHIFNTKNDVSACADAWHKQGLTVALVPTMGYLHSGHLSLIKQAKAKADRVIVSIFVNPTQFGPNEDFTAYPRNEEQDLAYCKTEGADAVFLPQASEMYPADASVSLIESTLSKGLCGLTRPTHFAGVLTVVNKLFNISRADVAVFGMKDAQQLAIIRRMVRDLDMRITLIPAPIVREADGLAMSSRNVYLSAEERQHALCLRQSLNLAEISWQGQHTATADVIAAMTTHIQAVPCTEIDYIVAVDADTLEPVETLRANTLIALAVKVGKTRLIDNIVLN